MKCKYCQFITNLKMAIQMIYVLINMEITKVIERKVNWWHEHMEIHLQTLNLYLGDFEFRGSRKYFKSKHKVNLLKRRYPRLGEISFSRRCMLDKNMNLRFVSTIQVAVFQHEQ